jgi:precorrin-4/cobalt-precorrin-4 C11-methyltransferase
VRALRDIVRRLAPLYGEACPVAVAVRVGWPDQILIRGTLATIHEAVRAAKVTRTALILVGPALGEAEGFPDSALYDGARPHVLRPRAAR